MKFEFGPKKWQREIPTMVYYDYQLSKGRRKFGDEVLAVKITVLSWATYLVSSGNNINSRASPVASPPILRALPPMTSKADKLPLETESVAPDNNTTFTLKPADQTFVALYSPDNRSMTSNNANKPVGHSCNQL